MTASYKIFIPSEYQALLDGIEKERLRIVVETMMNTGARYSELSWICDHPASFDHKNNAISLPEVITKTKKGRVIHLTPTFSKRLYLYLREHKKIDIPSRRVMDENLKRWWLYNDGIGNGLGHLIDINGDIWYPTCKTFRKTWESWLLFAKKEDGTDKYSSRSVAESMGHTELISYGYYSNKDPRLKSELKEVNERTEGWGT